MKGYYLAESGYCAACVHPCNICDSKDTCKECVEGFIIANQKCVKCGLGCAFCYDLNSCEICEYNYYLAADRKSCVKSCKTNEIIVYDYREEKSLDQILYCSNCSDKNCLKCDASFSICSKCQFGYSLWRINNSNIICKAQGTGVCHINCATCSGDGPNDCLSCPAGSFLNMNASSCSSVCPDGTFQDIFQKACLPCLDKGCQNCNKTHCLECRPGFFEKADGTCLKCSEDCEDCSDNKQCNWCKYPFLLNYNELEG